MTIKQWWCYLFHRNHWGYMLRIKEGRYAPDIKCGKCGLWHDNYN